MSILWGAVTWPNEQDIAPETLLAELIAVENIESELRKISECVE